MKILMLCMCFLSIGLIAGQDETTDEIVVVEATTIPSNEQPIEITTTPIAKPATKATPTEKIKVKNVVRSKDRFVGRTKPITTKSLPVEKTTERNIKRVTETPREVPIVKTKELRKVETSRPSEQIENRKNIKNNSVGPDNYSFSFQTEDGHNRNESVSVDRTSKTIDDEDAVSAKGSYSFISEDGFEYSVTYVADGKGYRPRVNVRKVR